MSMTKTYSPGSKIFREGEPGQCAFIIERGAVEISALKNGKDLPLARLGPGDLFGEMALIDDEMRTASATTLEETDLVMVPRDYFRGCMDDADPILNVFLRVVLDRFRVTHQVRISGQETIPFDDQAVDDYRNDRQLLIDNLQRQQELEYALENGELLLHYQPIIALAGGECVGLEALIRWQHPTRGLIPPGGFIGFAEKVGTIVPMGLWALRESLSNLEQFQQIRRKQNPDAPPLFISINLSPRQLANHDDVETIIEALDASGVDPSIIHLEITETVLMHDPLQASKSLGRLKEAGVALAIDDFGTGYSSLGYLHRFPIDHLKIDRTFIDSMLGNPSSMKIVRTVVRLAKDLKLAVIAEGIETREQLAMLREIECEYAQGYLFAPPSTPNAITKLLKSGQLLV